MDRVERYIPPELRPVVELAGMMNPVQGIMEGMSAVGRGDYGGAALDTALAASPIVAARLMRAPAKAALAELFGFGGGLGSVEPSLGSRSRRRVSDELSEDLSSGLGAAEDVRPSLRAYHFSPYDFDRFSMEKIGTGEGAQAYGRGLYFGGALDVPEYYRRTISHKRLRDRFLNYLPSDADFDEVEDVVNRGLYDESTDSFERIFDDEQTRFLKALSDNDWLGFEYPSQAISAALRDDVSQWDPSPELLDSIKSMGKIYEVEIGADPEDFLDWDRPLSEQSQKVRDVFAALDERGGYAPRSEGPYRPTLDEDPSGRQLVGGARDALGIDNYSRALSEAGIPGIKYFDAMSRDAGEGTRNYVVFDENLIRIVRKYGVAGAAALLGVSASDVEAALASGEE